MYNTRILCENGLPVLGIFPVGELGSLVVHELQEKNAVVSLNGVNEVFICPLSYEIHEDDDGEQEMQQVFKWGELVCPIEDIMRL